MTPIIYILSNIYGSYLFFIFLIKLLPPRSTRTYHSFPTRRSSDLRHFSMLREFQLADWFTLANAFCGTGAVFVAMRFLQEGVVRDLMIGMALIPLAFIFDALDGQIGRAHV